MTSALSGFAMMHNAARLFCLSLGVLVSSCSPRPHTVPEGAIYSGVWPTDGYWIFCEDQLGPVECAVYAKNGVALYNGTFLRADGDLLRRHPDLRRLPSLSLFVDGQYLVPYQVLRQHDQRLTVHVMKARCAIDLGAPPELLVPDERLLAWSHGSIAQYAELSLDDVEALLSNFDQRLTVDEIDNCITKLDFADWRTVGNSVRAP